MRKALAASDRGVYSSAPPASSSCAAARRRERPGHGWGGARGRCAYLLAGLFQLGGEVVALLLELIVLGLESIDVDAGRGAQGELDEWWGVRLLLEGPVSAHVHSIRLGSMPLRRDPEDPELWSVRLHPLSLASRLRMIAMDFCIRLNDGTRLIL